MVIKNGRNLISHLSTRPLTNNEQQFKHRILRIAHNTPSVNNLSNGELDTYCYQIINYRA